jgi:hypothetical protein
MLSNLNAKSNLIEDCSDKHLSRLSAIDLNNFGQITYRFFFDERIRHQSNSVLPTIRQNKEWDARLFWGGKEISLKDNERYTQWIIELAQKKVPNWKEFMYVLDVEEAFEWLWLCFQIQKITNRWSHEIKEIMSRVSGFLAINRYEPRAQIERILSFTEEG